MLNCAMRKSLLIKEGLPREQADINMEHVERNQNSIMSKYTDGNVLMDKHIKNRDYTNSRLLMEAIKKFKEMQMGGPGSLTNGLTFEDFMQDPSGLKKRLKEMSAIDDATKAKIIDNALRTIKTKE